jgi:SAM-dependent methyltransferase
MTGNWIRHNKPEEWNVRADIGDALDYVVADCGSQQSHRLRLEALLQLPISPGDHLLDFGCGTGYLAELLPRGVRYTGVDWSAKAIELARRRRQSHTFIVGTDSDMVPADWIVASGPFNYASGWSKARTADVLGRMWSLSRRGIATTVRAIPGDERLHYSAADLLGYVPEAEWSNLEFDCSYLPNDLCLRAWRAQ